jgi:mono/diheme cytochrome c family protein
LAGFDPIRRSPWRLWSAGLLAVLAALWPALVDAQTKAPEKIVEEDTAAARVAWEDKPYEVVDGKVDSGTFNGYRRYQSHCHVCHGPDGLGSSYAPPLIESLAQIGYDGYVEAVMYGIENVSQTRQSVMPAFAEVEEVVNHVDDIYSYLRARADGVIGRGRPERLPN